MDSQPIPYPADCQQALTAVVSRLKAEPDLVCDQTIFEASERLWDVWRHDQAVVHLGVCTESVVGGRIADFERQWAGIQALRQVDWGGDVCWIYRMAGQFCKPRSQLMVDGELSYRGDLVHSLANLRPDPERLWQGYLAAKQAMELLQTRGDTSILSHEYLHLAYASAWQRPPYYRATALPWLGARTFHPKSIHFRRLINHANPLAFKVGPWQTADAVVAMVQRSWAEHHRPLLLIYRFSQAQTPEALAELLPKVASACAGLPLLWLCDPMHGNTYVVDGRKWRAFDEIAATWAQARACHQRLGIPLHGVHLEVSYAHDGQCLPQRGCEHAGPAPLVDPQLDGDQVRLLLSQVLGSW